MRLLRGSLLLVVSLFTVGLIGCGDDDVTGPDVREPAVPAGQNVVIQWDKAALQAIVDTKPGPPQTARALAIVHTCMYDAWAPYDSIAAGTRFGGDMRRPAAERKDGFKAKAISYAAYRALCDLYPSAIPQFSALMTTMGYDPSDVSRDEETPSGIGNMCAAAVLAFRHVDGSNQLGDLNPGAYTDYTGYQPLNPPISIQEPTTLAQIPHPDHWQPLTFVNGAGQTVTPGFICPHWGNVIPFAMTSPSQFRPGPPAAFGTPAFKAQCDELIHLSANLNDTTKVSTEYWADGPGTYLPPGHFCVIGQFVSDRDHNTLDQDVKLFFALTNAQFDAGIAAWEAKRVYDYVRPVTAIRYLYNDSTIVAWGGPQQGAKPIPGNLWKPFQTTSFPTPPFPEYTSGHSAFSAAAAEVLKRFTGSDVCGFSYTIKAGNCLAEPGTVPAHDITFVLATFSDAADQAGMSRRYGGIHFRDADLRSRHMGRLCGTVAWEKAESFWSGFGKPFRLPGETAP